MNFVKGKYVAFFPAAKAILQVAGYLTDIHGMGHLVHLIIENTYSLLIGSSENLVKYVSYYYYYCHHHHH